MGVFEDQNYDNNPINVLFSGQKVEAIKIDGDWLQIKIGGTYDLPIFNIFMIMMMIFKKKKFMKMKMKMKKNMNNYYLLNGVNVMFYILF